MIRLPSEDGGISQSIFLDERAILVIISLRGGGIVQNSFKRSGIGQNSLGNVGFGQNFFRRHEIGQNSFWTG